MYRTTLKVRKGSLHRGECTFNWVVGGDMAKGAARAWVVVAVWLFILKFNHYPHYDLTCTKNTTLSSQNAPQEVILSQHNLCYCQHT